MWFQYLVTLLRIGFVLIPLHLASASETKVQNQVCFVKISDQRGSYEIGANEFSDKPVIQARVAAQVDHEWIGSTDFLQHRISKGAFQDALGSGSQIIVTSTGLSGKPDISYTVRLYDRLGFGTIRVAVENRAGRSVTIQSIRLVEGFGERILDLGGPNTSERVLSDSFSEDWPPLRIYDLSKAPDGTHRAVGSQLIYNLATRRSVFFGALSSDRFLTIMHLGMQLNSGSPRVASYTIDATGTTEIQATDPESGLRNGLPEDLVELSLPLPSGSTISSESLMFSVGKDYHTQLEDYGATIRALHHARVDGPNLLGWWSWTAYYTKINQGNTLTNALWLAEHLKPLGYNYFHFDLGYAYARSEYTTPNASQFPGGMRALVRQISGLGLNVGVWTAPFEVGERSWVYQNHKDWLVQNARAKPIRIGDAEEVAGEKLYVLDSTNPEAQEYLRLTYQTLARDWGIKYIKLDFMDNTAVEGHYFRPDTTAIEAQRIGLEIIRKAVGPDVLLDKDGSPMLNPVGLVDEGRISQDTGHSFLRSKEAAPGIAARYYMHRNFFVNDPDAITVSRQLIEEREIQAPLTMSEAEVSIALAAVSGGMIEIGDDLPTLGTDAARLELIRNSDLLQMARVGRTSVPIDLLTYVPEDEQPSVFLLHEDKRQTMLAVFNWTERPRSHSFTLEHLKLPENHVYELRDVFHESHPASLIGNTLNLNNQAPHSVKMIKITDNSVAPAPPSITIQAPAHAKIGEEIRLSSAAAGDGVPVLIWRWEFGDGTSQDGLAVAHTYTVAGSYTVRVTAEGVDGIAAVKTLSISVDGVINPPPPQRYVEPSK